MRKTIKVTGKGFSEQQAKVNAYNELKATYKNNILVYGMLSCVLKSEPKAGNQCTTDNRTASGARKWVTKHNIYAENPNDATDLKKLPMDETTVASKTDALKKAKELALQHQAVFHVKLEKELADGEDNTEAIVKPKGAVEGKWEIDLDVEVIA